MIDTRRFSWRTAFLVIFLVACASDGALAQGWTAQTSGTTEVLNGVWFLDAARGFAVGDAGTILETGDGGQSWSALNLTVDDMQDVAFRNDDSIGLIVGDNGTIFRTTNAGQDWVGISSGTVENLVGVAFGGGGLAYAAGRDGTIFRSDDAGVTWISADTGTARYRAVAAFGPRAWVVGNDGVMRASSDGGANWFSPTSGTPSDLHDVVFVSVDEGWAVGQNNTVLYTADGGTVWAPRGVGIGVGLNTVFFGNPDLGWTGGALGNVYRSTDGGLAWPAEPTPTLEDVNALHFADAFHGSAVTEMGTILTRVVPTTRLLVDRDGIEWDLVPDGSSYDLLSGDLGPLRASGGDFSVATDGCLAFGETGSFLEFTVDPPLAGDGLWILLRVNPAADVGTYDSGSFRQSGFRDAEIGASGVDCP